MFNLLIQGEMFARAEFRVFALFSRRFRRFHVFRHRRRSRRQRNADFLEGLFRKVPSPRGTFCRIFEGS